MSGYKEVARCRICGNSKLLPVLSLGRQALTGVFPRSTTEAVTAGPVDLVRCAPETAEHCGLVQLRQSYKKEEMYGANYGYHSGLNASMVKHLHERVARILARVQLKSGDLVVDIGSNDSTLLQAYPKDGPRLVGIDPTGPKFRKYYPPHVELIPNFFSAEAVRKHCGPAKARVVTSIAMFYDLESPMDFMREVGSVLADDGVWVFEQSYLPTMLQMNAYDTICHEHLEYYGLAQIKWMIDRAGLKIVDVELNATNGGSFAVTAAKKTAPYPEATATVDGLLRSERSLLTEAPFTSFCRNVEGHRNALRELFAAMRRERKTVFGYGASTKGNVILQYCGLTAADLPCIGEVNEDKFGSFTPGTVIPIVPEDEARAQRPDHFLVLPWHFRDFIVPKETAYLKAGGRLIFPLPRVEVV